MAVKNLGALTKFCHVTRIPPSPKWPILYRVGR